MGVDSANGRCDEQWAMSNEQWAMRVDRQTAGAMSNGQCLVIRKEQKRGYEQYNSRGFVANFEEGWCGFHAG
jgi:hypothetical protein